MSTPTISFVYPRRSTFAESDAAGVIHFSRIACYVEEAEHAWLESKGFPIALEEGALAWPRVAFQASFQQPIRPGQPLQVELNLSAQGRSSLTWFWRILQSGGTVAAEGSMKTVCCRIREGKLESTPLPSGLISP
jgi:acyl-CoA thioester hydrolase